MKFRDYTFTFFGGLYLALSLLSPFAWASLFPFVNKLLVDLRKLPSEIFQLILVFILVIVVAYLFANSTKQILYDIASKMKKRKDDKINELMETTSLIANLIIIVLVASFMYQEFSIDYYHNSITHIMPAMSATLISLAINSYLDKKYKRKNQDFKALIYIIAAPVFILNLLLLISIGNFLVN